MTPIEHLTKIKFLGDGKLQLAYELVNTDEFDVKYAEAPRREFPEAMAALVAPCLSLLELPASYASGVRATGVSLSWTGGIMGAVITLQKPIRGANAPVIFNTPHLPESPYSDGNEMEPTLPKELLVALDAVQDEAKAYIRGERAQMDLFKGNGNGQEESAPADAEEDDTLDMFGDVPAGADTATLFRNGEVEKIVVSGPEGAGELARQIVDDLGRELGVPVEEGTPA